MADTRTVLLMLDYQQGVVDRMNSDTLVGAACHAVGSARDAGVPVMFVRVGFRPGYPEVSPNNLNFASAAANAGEALHEANAATQIHPALQPRATEPIVVKRRISAFAGSDLDVLLRGAQADHLVLAGISTSGVVLSTLCEAADKDYRITVLSDACADRDSSVHEALMEKVFPKYAAIRSTDEWAASLS